MSRSEWAAAWRVGGCSVMGASHLRAGVPNQDAIAWTADAGAGPTAVLALADGHGAALHFRSGAGAHIAVEAATTVLSQALADPAWMAQADVAAERAVTRAIIARWRAAVIEDVARHPLPFGRGDPFIPYGSTLIAAAVAPEGILVWQIGDGELLLGRADDDALMLPLPDDVGLIGQQTYSLCQEYAEERVRARFIRPADDVEFLMLSTDGLAKSFAERDDFFRLAAGFRREIASADLEEFMNGLGPRLSAISHQGSGDDVTVGFLLRQAYARDP